MQQPYRELVVLSSDATVQADIRVATSIEHGRAVARDIGGSDPGISPIRCRTISLILRHRAHGSAERGCLRSGSV